MSTNYPTPNEPHDTQATSESVEATQTETVDSDLVSNERVNDSQAGYDDSGESELQQATNDLTDSDDSEAEVQYTPIKINILGRSYNINCPVGEEDELALATQHINTYIGDLRDDMPHIGYENLLVLCCLNLFNRVQQSDKDANANATANNASTEQARQLIDKLIADMQFFKD